MKDHLNVLFWPGEAIGRKYHEVSPGVKEQVNDLHRMLDCVKKMHFNANFTRRNKTFADLVIISEVYSWCKGSIDGVDYSKFLKREFPAQFIELGGHRKEAFFILHNPYTVDYCELTNRNVWDEKKKCILRLEVRLKHGQRLYTVDTCHFEPGGGQKFLLERLTEQFQGKAPPDLFIGDMNIPKGGLRSNFPNKLSKLGIAEVGYNIGKRGSRGGAGSTLKMDKNLDLWVGTDRLIDRAFVPQKKQTNSSGCFFPPWIFDHWCLGVQCF